MRSFLAALVPLLLSPPSAAAQSASLDDRVDAFIRRELKRRMIPGLALTVVRSGEIVRAAGYGMANVEHDVPVKPETVFQSGSVGKQFTATAIMMLVEDGRVALDDPIGAHLGVEVDAWSGITIRHLLTHTSGIPEYFDGIDLRQDYTEEQLLKIISGLALAFEPGESWSYSNSGYVLLGIMIGKITGQFYLDILRERIFAPLGMTTARGIDDAAIVKNRAAGYVVTDGELKNQGWVSPSLNSTADGALYLTVLDLARWDAALYGESILKRSSLEQMWLPTELGGEQRQPYGFGWRIGESGGRRYVGHSGGWQGFNAHIVRFLDDKLTVIVLCNLAGAGADSLSLGVASVYEPTLAPPIPEAVTLDAKVLDALAGDYALGARVYRVTHQDGGLVLETPDERLPLLAAAEDRFFTSDGDGVRFDRSETGDVEQLVAFGLRAKRRAPPAAQKPVWRWENAEILGHRTVPREEILRALPLEIGTRYEPDLDGWNALARSLEERFGFYAVEVSAVRFAGFKAYLVVDIIEKGDEGRLAVRPTPVGEHPLADPTVLAIHDRLVARSRVLFEEGQPSPETADAGFLDYADPEMHSIVLELVTAVPPHREGLLAVLAEDHDYQKRARAATLLNWAAAVEDSIAHAHPYANDAHGLVRNNVTRFMLHFLDRVESADVRRSIITEISRQIRRPSHADRNKAAYGLLRIVEHYPEHLKDIEAEAGKMLRIIAHDSILSNVKEPAEKLVKMFDEQR